MPLTPKMFLIVCPLLFLAGFVDSIAGGGGLISLPAYLFAGLPVHTAIGTNKLSSACGTSLTTARFIRGGLIRWKLALPGIAAAMVGSGCGSRLSLLADEKIIRAVLFAVLPLAAFIVLNPRLFPEGEEREVRVGLEILRALELAPPGASVTSCPTCGRTRVDVRGIATEVEAALERYRRAHGKVVLPRVAVMGCAVNGPGEAKWADIALCGGDGEFLLYVHGKPVRKVKPSEAVAAVLSSMPNS